MQNSSAETELMAVADLAVPDHPSLEQVRCSDAFPKAPAKRILPNGETEESSGDNSPQKETSVPPFVLLPGEFVQHYSFFATSQLFLTNYRLFVLMEGGRQGFHNVPLRSIESVEVREMFYLVIWCKEGRSLRIIFQNNESCSGWFKVIQTATAIPRKQDEIFACAFAAWAKDNNMEKSRWSNNCYPLNEPDLLTEEETATPHAPILHEFKRLGFDQETWRVTEKNKDFKFCPTYPKYWIVPVGVNDMDIEKAALHRSFKRVPAVVWRHTGNGAVLLRSSQPLVGLFSWRKQEDENLLQIVIKACQKDAGTDKSTSGTRTPITETDVSAKGTESMAESKLSLCQDKTMLILDARSYAAAWANRAKGGGYESPEYYQNCEIQFVGLPNIHTIRKSFQQLRTLCSSMTDMAGWFPGLESTRWLQYLSCLLVAASTVIDNIHCQGRPVLVHCSDGWDRTTQIVCLAKLCLDPYYRTMKGFKWLIERDWLEFGHKFSDRCGLFNEDINERAPVFLQWLDCVYQLVMQNPCAFEFNQSYLVKLAQHTYSGLFGTFLGNSSAERHEWRLDRLTFSIWSYLHPSDEQFRNVLYSPNLDGTKVSGVYDSGSTRDNGNVIWPRFHLKELYLWQSVYCAPPSDPSRVRGRNNSGLVPNSEEIPKLERSLTKAHSCENLVAVEGSVSPGLTSVSAIQTGCNLVRTGSDSNLSSSQHFDGSCGCIKHPSLSNSLTKENSSSSLGLFRTSTDRLSCRFSHFGTSPPTVEDETKKVIREMLQSVVEDSSGTKAPLKEHEESPNEDYSLLTHTGCSDEPTSAAIESSDSETRIFEIDDDHRSESLERQTREPVNIRPSNGLLNGAVYMNGGTRNGHIIPLPLELNCGQTAVDVFSSNGSSKPTSFELGAEALGDVDYVDSGSLRTANRNMMQTSSSSTVTNGHNGYADLTPPVGPNSRELSTSTTEISDSHMRNPYGAPRMIRNGVLYVNDFNENPIACSSRQNSLASLTNGHHVVTSSQPLDPTANFKSTSSKRGRSLAAAVVAEKEKGSKKPDSLVHQWIDDDGLTKIPDVIQERMADIAKAYERRIEQLMNEVQQLRMRSDFMQQVAQNNLFRSGIRNISNGSSSAEEQKYCAAASDLLEPCSYESCGGQSDISWEAVEEKETKPTLWIPDHVVTKCMGCDTEFWVMSRRHHCRSCGKIFCSNCTRFECPVPSEQHYDPVRVCNCCYSRLKCRDATAAVVG